MGSEPQELDLRGHTPEPYQEPQKPLGSGVGGRSCGFQSHKLAFSGLCPATTLSPRQPW